METTSGMIIIQPPSFSQFGPTRNYDDYQMDYDKVDMDVPMGPIKDYGPRSILYNSNEYVNDLYENMSTRQLYPIRILRWVDPVDIWIELSCIHRRVKELNKLMQKWYSSTRLELEGDIWEGMPCAFKDGTRWRRGLVKEYPDGCDSAVVRFVDKGCDRWVDRDKMKPLLNIFTEVPPRAIHAKLFGVQMAELDGRLIKRANDHFRYLSDDFSREFACRFVTTEKMYSLETYKIELYDIDQLNENGESYELMDIGYEYNPNPDADLVAQSGLFKLSRGNWKNYDEFAKHRVHKKRVSFYEDPEYCSSESEEEICGVSVMRSIRVDTKDNDDEEDPDEDEICGVSVMRWIPYEIS